MAALTTLALGPIFLVVSFVPTLLINAKTTTSFSLDLIHRDSTKSPLYNPDESKPPKFGNAVRRSIIRARLLEHKLQSSSAGAKFVPLDNEAPVIADNGEYLVHISLGTPTFPIVAIADTGSDIIWTQCEPCTNCYSQTAPMFNPKSSSTYREIPCSSSTCTSLSDEGSSCTDGGDVCQYQVSYGDQSYTRGDLAIETLTLDSTSGRKVGLPKIIIGCSQSSQGTFSPNGSGIVGLGGGSASLVRQMESTAGGKFSYCLTRLGEDTPSTLTFGQSASVSRALSTPLISDPSNPTFYFLHLEAISIGTKRIPFTGGASTSSKGNIIIDSGTTLTFVPSNVLSELADAVSSQVSSGTPVEAQDLKPCYQVEDFESFEAPMMTMHFDGADVELKMENTFIEVKEKVVCFAFYGSNSLAIYGNVAQQNFLVGYDLKGETVSFKPTDCTRSSSS